MYTPKHAFPNKKANKASVDDNRGGDEPGVQGETGPNHGGSAARHFRAARSVHAHLEKLKERARTLSKQIVAKRKVLHTWKSEGEMKEMKDELRHIKLQMENCRAVETDMRTTAIDVRKQGIVLFSHKHHKRRSGAP